MNNDNCLFKKPQKIKKKNNNLQFSSESKVKVEKDPEVMSRFQSSEGKLQQMETKAAGRGK